MKDYFYLVGKSSCERGGIYQYRENQGSLEELSFAPLSGCNWLSPSPDGKYMYATCGNGEETPGCAAFRISDDGSLIFLNKMSSEGKAPCYTVVSSDGKFLYCANYLTGRITEFRLADHGSIAERMQVITHTGKGPNQPRQAGLGRMASRAGVGHGGFRAPVGHRSGRTDIGFQRIPAGA